MERGNHYPNPNQIVEQGELGGVPFQVQGGEIIYHRDEGSEEQSTRGGVREILDVKAGAEAEGVAEIVIGDRRFQLPKGWRLTIERTETEPDVTRIEKPKTLMVQRAAEARPQLYSGTAVKHLKLLGIPLLKTGNYDFEGGGKTWEEIQALHRDGWETPHLRIER